MSGVPTPNGPPGGGPPVPVPALDCDSTACRTALGAVIDDQNNIIMKCAQINTAQGWVNFLLSLIGVIFGIMTAVIAYFVDKIGLAVLLAIIVGTSPVTQLVDALILILAVFLSIILTLLTIILGIEIYILVLRSQLGNLQNQFLSDLKQMKASCPTGCWIVTALPEC
jgi:hypothetical protein